MKQVIASKGNSDPAMFNGTSWHTGFGNAHNIYINEDTGFAYIVGSNMCNKGLYMMKLEPDPAHPTFAGCFGDDGYVHDVHCVVYHGDDARYTGREICIA